MNERFGVVLDPNEAVAFALHFVNAGFTSEGLSRTVQMTKTITNLFRLFEETTGWIVDRDSMGAARFVTHLRYLFVRLSAQKQITTTPQPLLDAIVMVHGEAFTLANKMRYLIEMDFGGQLTDDEIAYLTLHVARLREDQRIGGETE